MAGHLYALKSGTSPMIILTVFDEELRVTTKVFGGFGCLGTPSGQSGSTQYTLNLEQPVDDSTLQPLT